MKPTAREAYRPSRFAAVAWTGRKICLPSGLLDPLTGTFRPLPPGGPSHATRPFLWTGKEVIVAGGFEPPRFWFDVWALEPEAGTWRRLENYPKYRAEDAPGAAPAR